MDGGREHQWDIGIGWRRHLPSTSSSPIWANLSESQVRDASARRPTVAEAEGCEVPVPPLFARLFFPLFFFLLLGGIIPIKQAAEFNILVCEAACP